MSELEQLTKQIEELGLCVRELKSSGAEKAAIDSAVANLLATKAAYKAANGGVAFGPPPAPKEKKVVVQEVSKKEGPTKKELNKLKRKGAHTPKGEGAATGKDTPGMTVEAPTVPATSLVVVGDLNVFVHASAPADLSKLVAEMMNSKVKFKISELDTHEPMLVGGGNGSFSGDHIIAKFLADGSLYNRADKWACSQVDQWLTLYDRATGVNGDAIALLRLLEAHLADKTFIAGASFSLADVAMVLLARKKRGAINPRLHIERWFATANAMVPTPAGLTKNGNKVAATAVGATATDEGVTGTCPPLEGAVDGQVCTRFPPEPSGYLHIGHAKACLLNQYYANRYKGKLLVRFDDTNPSKEKEEYADNILKDLQTLKVFPDKVSHTSDFFLQMQNFATQMIKDGYAYMDDTDQDTVKEERMAKIESKCRNTSVDENLKIFAGLLAGDKNLRAFCMRAKIDMQSLNGTMRDPVIYRANDVPHHRTGTKFKAYPTYDFACPIVDSLEGVTHALRTTEYDDRDEQYKWMQKALKLTFITKIMTFGKMNFIHTVLSKRKLNWFVEQKLVEGWFDPRFPTIQGCLRRGIDIDAMKNFIISQGASRRVITMEWDKFWASNKDALEVTAPRYMGVSTPGEVVVTLENVASEITAHSVHLLPQIPEKGSRICRRFNKVYVDQCDAALFKIGTNVTFLRWGNMLIKSIEKNTDGTIASVIASYDADSTNFSKTMKVTWLAAIPDVVECTLVRFDHLISKPKLDEGDNFQDFLNEESRFETKALCDPCLRNVNAGTTIQLERKGFFRVDRAYGGIDKPAILFAIPDGKLVKK